MHKMRLNNFVIHRTVEQIDETLVGVLCLRSSAFLQLDGINISRASHRTRKIVGNVSGTEKCDA